jgi:hypothetical protein
MRKFFSYFAVAALVIGCTGAARPEPTPKPVPVVVPNTPELPVRAMLTAADTTVARSIDCGTAAWQAANPSVNSCRWVITLGGQPVPVPNGKEAKIVWTGAYGDSVQVVATAWTRINTWETKNPKSRAFWMKIDDLVVPGADSLVVRVTAPI